MTMPPGFESSAPVAGAPEAAAAPPRVLETNRTQPMLRPTDPEGLLPADQPARTLWACVERLDLTAFYAPIAPVEGAAGRPAIDPKILLTLWLHATSEGVGSARELARLCEAHDAYRWICGGVHVNYHTLSDFRVAHQRALDALLTETLAALLKQGLIALTRVAHDGTRLGRAPGPPRSAGRRASAAVSPRRGLESSGVPPRRTPRRAPDRRTGEAEEPHGDSW